MFIKVSFETKRYWQIAAICNFAKVLGAKIVYYSGGTGDSELDPLLEKIKDLEESIQDYQAFVIATQEELDDLCTTMRIPPAPCCAPKYCDLAAFHEVSVLRDQIALIKPPVQESNHEEDKHELPE